MLKTILASHSKEPEKPLLSGNNNKLNDDKLKVTAEKNMFSLMSWILIIFTGCLPVATVLGVKIYEVIIK